MTPFPKVPLIPTKIIISAPFGNYLKFANTTRTLGTYTLQNRGGIFYRLWRCALTLRYHWRVSAWTNRLGLPNPGLDALPINTLGPDISVYNKDIISIYGFNAEEWQQLAMKIAKNYDPLAVELNLSCPNVSHDVFLRDVMSGIDILHGHNIQIIAKLPPVKWMKLAKPLFDYGVKTFHCCNTIPTPGGGMSGKPLKQYSLWAVEDLKQAWGESVCVIGGGGISGPSDIGDYCKAGADHFAVGSALLNPFFWKQMEVMSTLKVISNPCKEFCPSLPEVNNANS